MTSGKRVVSNSILILLLVFVYSNSFAQKNTIKVFNVSGQAFINELLTPKQAKELALNDAKSNALRKAGIGEYIRSNNTLLSTSVGDKYDEYINTEQQSQLEGNILEYTVIKDTQFINNEKLLVVSVTIDATVIKYETKPDVNFDVRLFGVKTVYKNNDRLLFSVQPTIDCYLNFFSWVNGESNLMYPSSYEKSTLLQSDKIVLFPTTDRIDYKLILDKKESERGRLIFVFTKTPMKFIRKDDSQNTTPDEIISWINSIPLDQKKVFNLPFLIQE
jgi:hypothetical protein